MGGMRYAWLALLLVACDSNGPVFQAVDDNTRAPEWRMRGCYGTDAAMPMSGDVTFCPAVHDYARENDAGLAPKEILPTCDLWVWCPEAFGGCFNCAEWTPNPGAF